MRQGGYIIIGLTAVALLAACAPERRRGFRSQSAQTAAGKCDGDPNVRVGTFDVQLQPTGQADVHALYLFPIDIAAPGLTITVTVADTASLAYRTLINQTALRPGTTILAGYLTAAELDSFNALAISQYVPGVENPLNAQPQRITLCTLIAVGDGFQEE